MFRAEAKRHLEQTLVSFKAKNKVTTRNKNKSKTKEKKHVQDILTPRGQLHKETIYGKKNRYAGKMEKVGGSFDYEKIQTVTHAKTRIALLKRLEAFEGNPKKAFTAKNALTKNPIWLDQAQTDKVPEKVKCVTIEEFYTIRKEVSPDLKIEKVIDRGAQSVLQARLDEFDGNKKIAFSNLEENPIWLNEEKGIPLKRVTITGVSNAEPLHYKKDHFGNEILDTNGDRIPADFVSTGNNHHVAIYKDKRGKLQDHIVSFFEAVTRKKMGLPIIDKSFNTHLGWQFLFTMKQNEMFVFPNEKTAFNPNQIDLKDENQYDDISINLYRVQKLSRVSYGNSVVREYVFRHHLETTVNDISSLKDITFKNVKSLPRLQNVVKVRINHLGKIVKVGEY
jgi:CRISPR-associated endonuclease Csn1